jgi:hypothetical protein
MASRLDIGIFGVCFSDSFMPNLMAQRLGRSIYNPMIIAAFVTGESFRPCHYLVKWKNTKVIGTFWFRTT